MDFTREPIIETVITPREGCKLVVRSSKSTGQEEYFVDALEVVSFGNSFFFRSIERPKSFLVPTSDYEVLEVREARMALKSVGSDRKIKIAGGREITPPKIKETLPQKEKEKEKDEEETDESKDGRNDKRRDRRRGYRRRRGGQGEYAEQQTEGRSEQANDLLTPPPIGGESSVIEEVRTTTSFVSSLLPPPLTLISETIQRYKRDDLYKDAFFNEEKTAPTPVPTPETTPEEQPVTAVEEEKQENL